jgi:hypothetical protein
LPQTKPNQTEGVTMFTQENIKEAKLKVLAKKFAASIPNGCKKEIPDNVFEEIMKIYGGENNIKNLGEIIDFFYKILENRHFLIRYGNFWESKRFAASIPDGYK